jgi:hypothetical protein
MRQAVLVVVVLGAVAALAGAALSAATRFDPYKSLLASAYPDTALPAAFSSAKITAASPSSNARANGATGAVEVDVDGPDPRGGVLYIVFKTANGAAASMAAAVPPEPGLAVHAMGKVPGHSVSALYRGTATHTDALANTTSQGVTYAVIPDGNVLVAGFTYSVYAKSGDPGGARKLANSGLAHLTKLAS